MKQIIALLQRGFQSSSMKTKEFTLFARLFKKHFTVELANVELTLTKFNVGHFYVCGFFQAKTGQYYYFSISDVRGSEYVIEREGCFKIMWRTAKNQTDYSGRQNRYVSINNDMARSIADQIYMDINKVSFLLV